MSLYAGDSPDNPTGHLDNAARQARNAKLGQQLATAAPTAAQWGDRLFNFLDSILGK